MPLAEEDSLDFHFVPALAQDRGEKGGGFADGEAGVVILQKILSHLLEPWMSAYTLLLT
jgi:hypothetical protein